MQGSYANNTNVRTQSDVDIAVVEEDTFRTQYRSGVSDSNYGFVNVPSHSKGLGWNRRSFKRQVWDWRKQGE